MAVYSHFAELDCRRCNQQLKDARGCTKNVQPYQIIKDVIIDRCPLRYITFKEHAYLEGYFHLQNGILPGPGGWLAQPIKFSQAVLLIQKYTTIFQKEIDNGKSRT